MTIHPRKDTSVVLASRQKLLRKPLMLKLTLDTNLTTHVRERRLLGVTPNKELKWQSHIDSVCKQLAPDLYLLGQLKHHVNINCRKMFFKAHKLAHINYASTLCRVMPVRFT